MFFKWFFQLFRDRSGGGQSKPAMEGDISATFPLFQDPPKPELDDHAIIEFVNPSGPIVKLACGHSDHSHFKMSIFGKIFETPPEKGLPPWCRECALQLATYVARCCKCGSGILSGQTIILLENAEEQRTWVATYVEIKDQRYYLGCTRQECCSYPPAFAIGQLHSEGVHLPYGAESAAATASRTGEPAFIHL